MNVPARHVVLVLGTLSCLAGCADRAAGQRRPPNVVLLTIDTLRADRLGCYGHRLPTSPNIDRLAKRGVRFADCTVQWPKTWPSMASLLSGAYPRTIGVRLRQRVLHPDLLLLSEVLGGHGYRTGAVVSNYHLGTTFGYDQGFEQFVESWQEAWAREAGETGFRNGPGKVKLYTDARVVTEQGLRWLRGLAGEEPFFLWLHYMDPHGPYVPPPGYEGLFAEAYAPEPTPLAKLPPYQVQRQPVTGLPVEELGFYRAQYDREIRFLDDELGRLFDELAALGVDPRETLVVLAADHGESFGEHGYYLEHGKLPYQPSAHSPLIVVYEGRLPAGRTVESPVGLIDVAPTILELAGIEIPGTFEGRSLVPVMDGAGEGPEFVFMEAGYREPTQLSVRQGRWKLIHVPADGDRREMTGEPFELYDLAADPGETTNLAAERPELTARLGDVLRIWYEGGPRPERGDEVDLLTLDPEAQEMLRSLGYIR